MKSLKLLVAAVAIAASALTANAGDIFKFGPKVGMTVNSMHFNSDVFDGKNRAGWTAGLMTEFKVPVIGIGADLSLMYVRRNSRFMEENEIANNNRDYIEIPLNLRYNFSFPVVSKVAVPYLAIGPSVSVLTSKKAIEEGLKNKSVDWALNFGIGCQLISHLDISARYGLGLTKAVRGLDADSQINGKNRYWTVSLAYLF